MGFFTNSSNSPKRRKSTTRHAAPKARLQIEALEDRTVPTTGCPGITGFVYHDANNNGLFDSTLGETPIVNSQIELHDSTGALVATTKTNSQGFYDFHNDPRISQAVTTVTRTATVPVTQTNFDISKAIQQFDPSVGDLQSVDIINTTSLSSDIKAENASTVSSSTITGTVDGRFTLTLPGGQTLLTNPKGNAGSFNASIFDGVLDYAGTSGKALPTSSASDSKTQTLTGTAINAYIGTGTVNFRQQAVGASSVSDTAGNADSSIRNRGSATITVVYHYIPENCLEPGNYTLIQTSQPPGYMDGKESSNGTVIANSVGTDSIAVTLGTVGDAVHNDFGEVVPSTLSGYVYVDAGANSYNDGIKTAGEQSIPGVVVRLTGTNDIGQSINYAVYTDANGFYKFMALRPGNYTLTETQPNAYLDGKDTIGTPGGNTSNDQFTNILLASRFDGVNNNFGELPLPGSLSGYVYVDASKNGFNDGAKQSDEAGIAGVTVTLTGTSTNAPVNRTTTTDANGFYQFQNLTAGTYTVTESQPAGYLDGKDTIGSLSGVTTNDQHSSINVPAGANGINYNFGELPPQASLSGYVYLDTNKTGGFNDGIKQGDEAGIAGVTVTITGSAAAGSVTYTTTTNSIGFYQFAGLNAGTYTLNESQPSAYVDGKDTIGSLGGITTNDQHATINLPAGGNGINYNFGELERVTRVDRDPPYPPVYTWGGLKTPPRLTIASKLDLIDNTGGNDINSRRTINFVAMIYQSLLNRTVDQGALAYWVRALNNGTSRAAFVASVYFSPEHRNYQTQGFFTTILGRDASAADRAYYGNLLAQGFTESDVAAWLLSSQEYASSRPGDDGFVYGMYGTLTGSGNVDDASLNYWLGRVQAAGRFQAAKEFLVTPTVQSKIVENLYRIYLHTGSAAEISYWVNILQTHRSTEANLAVGFLASDEFYVTKVPTF